MTCPTSSTFPFAFGVTWPSPLTPTVSVAFVAGLGKGLGCGTGGGLVSICAPGRAAAARTAAPTFTRPLPYNGFHPGEPESLAVVSNSVVISSAERVGLAEATNAAAAATIGLANDVPRHDA